MSLFPKSKIENRKSCLRVSVVILVLTAQTWAEERAPKEIVVSPAAEPVPALKHQLLPTFVERHEGNAALGYAEAITMMGASKWDEAQDGWLGAPLETFAVEEAESFLRSYRSVVERTKLAARRSHCDWELPIHEMHPFQITMGQIQEMRSLARIIALSAKVQIKRGKYEEAIDILKAGFAMGRHAADGPTVIQALIGVAIEFIMLERIEELIQQPDAPNLYWALTALPRPLIDMRQSLDYEMYVTELILGRSEDLSRQDRTVEEWRMLAVKLLGMQDFVWSRKSSDSQITAIALKTFPLAKAYLLQHEFSDERIASMSPSEVIARYWLGAFREIRDDLSKWAFVPRWQGEEGIRDANARLQSEGAGNPLLDFLPSVQPFRVSFSRLERRIAELRYVEALRMYAAKNTGRMPASGDDLSRLAPAPENPMTGKPFDHTLRDGAVLLFGPAASDAPPSQIQYFETNLRITIRSN